MAATKNTRKAFTAIELLIVMLIISLLLQILSSAVLTLRESARITSCRNNLRQQAMAALSHEIAHQHFPTGGWNAFWIGDPDRGFDERQPGGWVYNVLPYLDQENLREMGRRQTEEGKRDALLRLQEQVIPIFSCPSRRLALAFESTGLHLKNVDSPKFQSRSDYAANGGDVYSNLGVGPKSFEELDKGEFHWRKDNNIELATGVVFSGSIITSKQILDGLSNTYLYGEKYLTVKNYFNGKDPGDDSTMFQGDDMDIARWTSPTVSDDYWKIRDRDNMPRQDSPDFESGYCFGSAHSSGWNVTFCDGSVRKIAYSLEPSIHERLGNRMNGEINSLD